MSGRKREDSGRKGRKKRRENVSLIKFSVLKREEDDVLTSKKYAKLLCNVISRC